MFNAEQILSGLSDNNYEIENEGDKSDNNSDYSHVINVSKTKSYFVKVHNCKKLSFYYGRSGVNRGFEIIIYVDSLVKLHCTISPTGSVVL